MATTKQLNLISNGTANKGYGNNPPRIYYIFTDIRSFQSISFEQEWRENDTIATTTLQKNHQSGIIFGLLIFDNLSN